MDKIKVKFKQKITRDNGREAVLIDREAELVYMVPDSEKLCIICGCKAEGHNKKHSFKMFEGEVADLKIYLPDGPEYDPWLGELKPNMVTHLRKNVEYGYGPNQWHYLDDDSI